MRIGREYSDYESRVGCAVLSGILGFTPFLTLQFQCLAVTLSPVSFSTASLAL